MLFSRRLCNNKTFKIHRALEEKRIRWAKDCLTVMTVIITAIYLVLTSCQALSALYGSTAIFTLVPQSLPVCLALSGHPMNIYS